MMPPHNSVVVAASAAVPAAAAKGRSRAPFKTKRWARSNGQPTGDDDDQGPAPLRAEPQMQLPQDPLAMPPEVKLRIGTDDPGQYAPPVGELRRSYYGVYYTESRGDYRLRLAPPFYIDHARGVGSSITLTGRERRFWRGR